jgi:hypothetical protein
MMRMSRDPRVIEILRWFESDHLPDDLREVSRHFQTMAGAMVSSLGDSEEMIAGLRKLLESKDCFVRAALAKKSGPRTKVGT